MKPVILLTFSSPQHAHAIRSVLEAHGVRCAVTGDQTADTLAVYGTAVVRVDLLVDESQLEQATEILNEIDNVPGHNAAWQSEDDWWWKCDQCDEANAPNFDECWSCAAIRPANPERIPPEEITYPEDTTELVANVESDDDSSEVRSPYAPPRIQTPAIQATPDEPKAIGPLPSRALRASIFGLFLPFPLAFYGAWLCVRCFVEGEVDRRVWIATFISLPTFLIALFMLLAAFMEFYRFVS